MATLPVKVILKNKPSEGNTEVLDFIEENLRSLLTRGKIRFQFQVVSDKDNASLLAQNIDQLPAAVFGGELVFDSVNIIKRLQNRLAGGQSKAKSKLVSDPEEALKDMFMNEMNKKKKDEDDDEDDIKGALENAAKKEWERRQSEMNDINRPRPGPKPHAQNRPQNAGGSGAASGSSRPRPANVKPLSEDEALINNMFEQTE